MISSFIRGSRLRHWLSRPGCPPRLKECKKAFDNAFGKETNKNLDGLGADLPSSYQLTPKDLVPHLQTSHARMRTRYTLDGVVYFHASTHVGNSLVMFYPKGKGTNSIPGSIKYIIDEPSRKLFAINRQLPAAMGTIDPFRPYKFFPAKIFSTKMSPELELIEPDWVETHYACWAMDAERAVVLPLSTD